MLGFSKTDPKQKNVAPFNTSQHVGCAECHAVRLHHATRVSRVIQRRRLAPPALDLPLRMLPSHPARTGCAATVQYLAGILKSTWILKSRHCSGLAIRHAKRMTLSIGARLLGRSLASIAYRPGTIRRQSWICFELDPCRNSLLWHWLLAP